MTSHACNMHCHLPSQMWGNDLLLSHLYWILLQKTMLILILKIWNEYFKPALYSAIFARDRSRLLRRFRSCTLTWAMLVILLFNWVTSGLPASVNINIGSQGRTSGKFGYLNRISSNAFRNRKKWTENQIFFTSPVQTESISYEIFRIG